MENKDEFINGLIRTYQNSQVSVIKDGIMQNLKSYLISFNANISEDVKNRAEQLIKKHYDEPSYEDVSGDIASDPNCQKGKKNKKNGPGCVMQGGRKKRSLSKRSKSKKSKKNSKRSKKLKRSRGGSKKNSKRSKNNKKKN